MATWGELRAELAAQAPGRGNDLLTIWLQRSYREILDHRDWKGLHGDAILQTVAEYATGTVSLTKGSTAIIGTGTTFTNGMTGKKFAPLAVKSGTPSLSYQPPQALSIESLKARRKRWLRTASTRTDTCCRPPSSRSSGWRG